MVDELTVELYRHILRLLRFGDDEQFLYGKGVMDGEGLTVDCNLHLAASLSVI